MSAAAREKEIPAQQVAIASIRTDGGTQSRAAINVAKVDEYAEDLDRGVHFPPPTVFYDGADYWLADGFHRLRAYERIGRKRIDVEVRQGTVRDAILHSVGANATHGLHRTNADKRRAVEMLLRDEEWGKRSDRWIADKCGVGHQLVAHTRAQLDESSSSKSRVGQDGKTRAVPKPKPKAEAPPPPEKPAPKLRVVKPPLTDESVKPALTQERVPAVPGKWECPDCLTFWPTDVTTCAHCADDDGPAAFDPVEALEATDRAFENMMLAWPKSESFDPVIDWLETKLGMTREEAKQWAAQ